MIFSVLLLVGLYGPAQSEDVVKVGIFDFPPFYTVTPQQTYEGLLIDYSRAEFEKAGLTPAYKIFHTPVLMKRLVNGDVDVGMLIKHPLLIGNTLYSQKPISSIHLVAYRGKNTAHIESHTDLQGKKVLTLSGYGYGGLLKKVKALETAPYIIEASDIDSGIDMLLAGRADYFLSYLKPSKAIAQRKGFEAETSWLVADSISKFDVFWVVSKKAENPDEILRKLEAVQ
ncbi:transporter substrate-binding domain-containing protein [Terasakiella sp. A23]|uniref:substrate-binding periplasmic protein n=1 Tax=Terasakiella sp. FCG-A23 TaxID=3080561 RepID=UPI0029554235|nr:transporter substrate-binding domain-containing protein [Terasakiella sp. A23]MDV7340384.1 transporter substrate-binding domain-containing protein [Terasakiella sp. A23]